MNGKVRGNLTRNIFKKDIRRLSNTDNLNATKFAGFRRNFLLPLKSKTSEVVVLFLFLFCLVLCTAYSMHLNLFFFNLGIHQQGFGNNVLSPKFLRKRGVLTIN